MQRNPRSRRLGVESLEDRSLLAGNVLASVDANGLLTITGDDANNYINIKQLPASGPTTPWPGVRLAIEALGTNNTTKINGQSAAVVEGVKNVNISMNAGGDTVYVVTPGRPNQLTALPGTVNIDMGNETQNGQGDGLNLFVENHGQLNINLGTGRDSMTIWKGIAFQINVQGDPDFHAGDPPVPAGDDAIRLYDVTAGGRITIDSKYGNDQVEVFGTGTNPFAGVFINTASGNDKVLVGGDRNGAIRVDTGDGNDYVQVYGMPQSANVTVNTGRGNDSVQVGGSATDAAYKQLVVWLGEGDDRLDLVSVKSMKSILGGGDGTDSFITHQSHPNDFGDATTSGFEVIQELDP